MIALSTPTTTPASTAQTLRPYQVDAIQAVKLAWAKKQKPLVSMATGLGKTTVISQLLVDEVDPERQRALVIAHTQELIYQPYERISNQFGKVLKPFYLINSSKYTGTVYAPGIGIVMGAQDAPTARIVIATRQSLHPKRLQEVLDAGVIDVLIIDEAHHASPGSTYGDIVQALTAANPKLRMAGFTATPKRTDNKALAAVFDEITFHYGIKEAIRDGWLVPVSRIRVKTQVQTENIPAVSGDYHKKKLIAVLDSSNWVELAVQAYKDYIQKAQRPCLAFFPEVAQSRRFAAALMEAGIPAAHIDANTPKDERADILRDYKAGRLLAVSNMGVLVEGFDAAHTSAILMARPTRSATLLTQIIGRGLRLHPGKSDCLIVDLTVSDTKVLEAGSLTGRQRRCQQCSVEFYLGFKACPHCGTVVPGETKEERDEDELALGVGGYRYSAPKGEGTGLHEEVASLFDSLSAAWHKGAEGWYSCSVGETGAMVIAPPSFHDPERARQRLARGQALLGQFDEADRNELIAQMDMVRRMLIRCDQHTLYFVRKSSNSNNRSLSCEYLRPNGDLISLMAEADVEVLKRAGSEGKALSKRDATWRLQLPSDGQLGYLRSLGWTGPMESKGVAAALITHITSTRRVLSWIEDDTLPEPEEN